MIPCDCFLTSSGQWPVLRYHVIMSSLQGKFQAFYQYAKTFNSDDFDYEALKTSDYVFMRWKVSLPTAVLVTEIWDTGNGILKQLVSPCCFKRNQQIDYLCSFSAFLLHLHFTPPASRWQSQHCQSLSDHESSHSFCCHDISCKLI